MKKTILIITGLIIMSSIGFAQNYAYDWIQKDNSFTSAADLYSPVLTVNVPTPKNLSPNSITQMDGPTTLAPSSGPSKNYSEHLVSCREHRNYDFKNKKWNTVPALPEWKCTELWGLYVLTKQKIGYHPINTPNHSQEVR